MARRDTDRPDGLTKGRSLGLDTKDSQQGTEDRQTAAFRF